MTTSDLSAGSPFKRLLAFALPMVISVCFQQFYNLADSLIAGRFVSDFALAAITAGYPITMIFIAIGVGGGVGCGVVISKFFGQGKYSKVRATVSTALISVSVLAAVCTVVGVAVSSSALTLMNTPASTFDDAKSYLDIYIYGLFFLFVYNACSSAFQALGNSKTPLYLLVFSSVFNIVLDIVLVTAADMGVKGLAIATLVAQGISCVLSLFLLFRTLKSMPKDINTEDFSFFSFRLLKALAAVAVPSIIQQSIVSVGQLFVQSLINSCGEYVLAAYGAAFKINMFVIYIFSTLSNAIANYTAQNAGAAKYENLKKGLKAGFAINISVAALACAVCLPLAKIFIGAFLNEEANPDIITIGSDFLYIVVPFYFFVAAKISVDGFLKGCGDMLGFMLSTFADLLLRVALSYALFDAMGGSYLGIWWSWPIGWVIAAGVGVACFLVARWKKLICYPASP